MSASQLEIAFDGKTIEPELDQSRLTTQLSRVYHRCRDGKWRTLSEIAHDIGEPEASVSARLRDLRKGKFGSHEVGRRRRPPPDDGTFEYRLIPNPRTQGQFEELLRLEMRPF